MFFNKLQLRLNHSDNFIETTPAKITTNQLLKKLIKINKTKCALTDCSQDQIDRINYPKHTQLG
jgi:hypothetical protein